LTTQTFVAFGLVELKSYSAGLAALDAMEKAGEIELLQSEINDLGGVLFKIAGETADVDAAIAAARAIAEQMQVSIVYDAIRAPAEGTQAAMLAKPEFSPLIEQDVVHTPNWQQLKEINMSEEAPFAIGMIETQGFTAVIEAIDTACKAANVEVLAREKLGGGYITVLIKGDVAAVKAAVNAGKERIEQLGLGKLIAAHVIPRPSKSVLALLPK
jgi:carbon dioxide concentrating mechanism protein CcmO